MKKIVNQLMLLAALMGGAATMTSCAGFIDAIFGNEDNPVEEPQKPEPPVVHTVDLSKLTADYVAIDGDVLTGTLASVVKISIADGATVTLSDVSILGNHVENGNLWAGISCLGDATIQLSGKNEVRGFNHYYPGIHVPKGYTLTIGGDGSLTASSNGWGAGIGSGMEISSGNIVIAGGDITAKGGNFTAAIGSAIKADCGDITITGGTVTATIETANSSNKFGVGIGCGPHGTCGNISITGGTVTATGFQNAAIGVGQQGTCGNISVSGGTITATGGGAGAGIGCSMNSKCGDIAITKGKDFVSFTGITNSAAYRPIGIVDFTKYSNVCGQVTIDGVSILSEDGMYYTCKPEEGVYGGLYLAITFDQKYIWTLTPAAP